MDYSCEYTDKAINDIDGAIDYIVNVLCNKNAALDLISKLNKSIEAICSFPKAYPDCTNIYISNRSIRHTIINNYILIYQILDNRVIILRFVYYRKNLSYDYLDKKGNVT